MGTLALLLFGLLSLSYFTGELGVYLSSHATVVLANHLIPSGIGRIPHPMVLAGNLAKFWFSGSSGSRVLN